MGYEHPTLHISTYKIEDEWSELEEHSIEAFGKYTISEIFDSVDIHADSGRPLVQIYFVSHPGWSYLHMDPIVSAAFLSVLLRQPFHEHARLLNMVDVWSAIDTAREQIDNCDRAYWIAKCKGLYPNRWWDKIISGDYDTRQVKPTMLDNFIRASWAGFNKLHGEMSVGEKQNFDLMKILHELTI